MCSCAIPDGVDVSLNNSDPESMQFFETMVIDIVAKNGILLLDAEHRFSNLGFSPEDSMIQAGRRRLRPIVMTALATVAGMLPLAFAIGKGSQMLKPLAITVVGGILSSMVLSLIFTPTIHYYLRPRTVAQE